MHTIYAAMQDADLIEGRGPMVPRGYFTRRDDAESFAKNLMGVQGIGHGEVKEIEVCDEIAEHPEWTKQQVIESAKAKLTDLELKALGISR